MFCKISGHKFTEIRDTIICEKCGELWKEKKEKQSDKPAVILKKAPLNLEEILNDKH